MSEEELPFKFKDCTALQSACCCTLPSHLAKNIRAKRKMRQCHERLL